MHPVELNQYLLPTPAIEIWVGWVLKCARGNILGAATGGRQRIGKSHAIEYFFQNYHRWLGNMVSVLSLEREYHVTDSKKALYKDLLGSMGHKTKLNDADALRDLFIGRVVDAASASVLKKVLIFIDEAHNLTIADMKWLLNLHNEVCRVYKVRILWMLVGQKELFTKRTTLIAEGQRQLVARFMRECVSYPELETVEDAEYIIGCFDDTLRWPLNNGPFYTEHFAPDAYKSGYRYKNDAKKIFDVLNDELVDNGILSSRGLTLEGFLEVVNEIALHQLCKLSPHQLLTKEMIKESARSTTWIVNEANEALLFDGTNSGFDGYEGTNLVDAHTVS